MMKHASFPEVRPQGLRSRSARNPESSLCHRGRRARVQQILLLLSSLAVILGAAPARLPAESAPRSAWLRAIARHSRRSSSMNPVLYIRNPKDGTRTDYGQIAVAGCTEPGSRVTVNGKPFRVYSNGAFGGLVSLDAGRNRIVIRAAREGRSTTREITVRSAGPATPLPRSPLTVGRYRPMTPDEDIEAPAGETIEIRCQASPGANVWFRVGSGTEKHPMRELSPATDNVLIAGVYEGFYTIRPEDRFQDAAITVGIDGSGASGRSGSGAATMRLPGRVTVAPREETRLARILESDTALYLTPTTLNRLTSVPRGTRLEVLGRCGSRFRVQLGESGSAWVHGSRIRFITPREDRRRPLRAETAGASVTAVEFAAPGSDEGAALRLRVETRGGKPAGFALPALVDAGEGGSTVTLTVWGLDEGTPLPTIQPLPPESMISSIRAEQPDRRTLRLHMTLATGRSWGYDLDFPSGDIHLGLRAPVRPRPAAPKPLSGVSICLDAGHGGADSGAVGSAGLYESDINLVIVDRLRDLLVDKGARVTLTRSSNVYVSLSDRVDRILASNADIFLSIHNNSVSSTDDPLLGEGTRLFYTHGAGIPLAKALYDEIQLAVDAPVVDSSIKPHRFYLTRRTPQMPGALVECLFLSHPEDEIRLLDSTYVDTLCRGIYKGVLAYLEEPGEQPSSVPGIADAAVAGSTAPSRFSDVLPAGYATPEPMMAAVPPPAQAEGSVEEETSDPGAAEEAMVGTPVEEEAAKVIEPETVRKPPSPREAPRKKPEGRMKIWR